MNLWEYKFVEISLHSPAKTFEQTANHWGTLGWELISVNDNTGVGTRTLVFKKPSSPYKF